MGGSYSVPWPQTGQPFETLLQIVSLSSVALVGGLQQPRRLSRINYYTDHRQVNTEVAGEKSCQKFRQGGHQKWEAVIRFMRCGGVEPMN